MTTTEKGVRQGAYVIPKDKEAPRVMATVDSLCCFGLFGGPCVVPILSDPIPVLTCHPLEVGVGATVDPVFLTAKPPSGGV